MQMSNCQTSTFLHVKSTDGEEQKCNQQSCTNSEAIDILEKQKPHQLTVNAVNTLNLRFSSYPEKLLPFNKRKSQYYICQEGESAVPVAEEVSCPEREMKRSVKIRTLRSIYEKTKPIATVKSDGEK